MGMILRIASSRIVGQGDIVGRSGYFSLNLSANSVMRGRLDARRTLKSLVADLRLYYLEVRQVFLDPKLSLKKLSNMIETNQTYLSNVVNRYFGCHLKELVNTYRVEYAKELLRSGKCPPEELPQRCGFLSRSAFYAAFKKITGVSPQRYMKYGQREKLSESTEYV